MTMLLEGTNSTIESILMWSKGTAETIADIHGVSHQTVRNIKQLKTKAAKKADSDLRARGMSPVLWATAKRFTEEEVADIRASSKNSKQIAKKYGVAPSTIRMIRTGKTYA